MIFCAACNKKYSIRSVSRLYDSGKGQCEICKSFVQTYNQWVGIDKMAEIVKRYSVVKQATKEARKRLNDSWKGKYPYGRLSLFAIDNLGVIKWYADIDHDRPTAHSRCFSQFTCKGKAKSGSWFLRERKHHYRSFSDPVKFMKACAEKGINFPSDYFVE